MGISNGYLEKNSINYADLLMPVNSAECVHCHESYIVNDPLDICNHDLENGDPVWVIYGHYFDIPRDVYSVWNIGERQTDIVRESLPIVTQWLEKLRNDIKTKENLYDLFFRTHSSRCVGPFYDEEEFYEVMKPFFEFYIKYWECVRQIFVDAHNANSNEAFEERYHELNHLLDELKFSNRCFWAVKLDDILKKGEILPYTKNFTFRWKTIMMQKNTNISEKRIQEIYVFNVIKIIESERKARAEYEALEIRRQEHFEKTWERWLPDEEIPF